ncbi:MAG: hypothetical protein R3F60_18895 [bacterium]
MSPCADGLACGTDGRCGGLGAVCADVTGCEESLDCSRGVCGGGGAGCGTDEACLGRDCAGGVCGALGSACASDAACREGLPAATTPVVATAPPAPGPKTVCRACVEGGRCATGPGRAGLGDPCDLAPACPAGEACVDGTCGTFSAVSSGRVHGCGLRPDSQIVCWGDASRGALEVPPGDYVAVSAGHSFTCALRADATLACWGAGLPASPPAGRFASVTAGVAHACALREDGEAVCWGSDQGEARPPAGRWRALSAGAGYTCGLREDGTLACFGLNNADRPRAPDGAFVQVAAGHLHACARRDDGSAVCWGSDAYGQLAVPAGPFASIQAGFHHTCGLRNDGRIECWGADQWGQSRPPAGEFRAIDVRAEQGCGVRLSGGLACWGLGDRGQTAPPACTPPTRCEPEIDCFSGACGGPGATCGGDEACARSACLAGICGADGAPCDAGADCAGGLCEAGFCQSPAEPCTTDAECAPWGDACVFGICDRVVQLSAPPVNVAFSANLTEGCARTRRGRALCWGPGDWRVLPEGPYKDVQTALEVACGQRLDGVVHCQGPAPWIAALPLDAPLAQIRVSDTHGCALRPDGTAVCAGHGAAAAVPPDRLSAITAGQGFSCGLTTDGEARCWGLDNPQGRPGSLAAPPGRFVRIKSSPTASCAQAADGSLRCWGGDVRSPEGRYLDFDVAVFNACGIGEDGVVRCWAAVEYEVTRASGSTIAIHGYAGLCTLGAGLRPACTTSGDRLFTGRLPDAGLVALAAPGGGFGFCGLEADGRSACVGKGWAVQVPAAALQTIAVGSTVCGLDAAGQPHCGAGPLAAAPALRAAQVVVGRDFACALGTDARVTCWGPSRIGLPDDRYQALAANDVWLCGLRLDGQATCVGIEGLLPDLAPPDPPPGPFDLIAAGVSDPHRAVCGRRETGEVVCWGGPSLTPRSPRPPSSTWPLAATSRAG